MVRHAFGMRLLLVGSVLTCGSSHVRADFLTTPWQSVNLFKPADPTGVGKQTNWDATATLNKFDPTTILPGLTGGQFYKLFGAELKLDYQFDNQISMRFDNAATIVVAAQGTLNLYFPASKTQLVPTASFSNSQTLTSSPSDVFSHRVDFPIVFSPPGSPGTKSGLVTDQTQLATYFTGPGTIGLPVSAAASSTFHSSSGNGFGSSITHAWATVSVRYLYLAVPEPSSIVLTALGIVGLAWAGRGRIHDEAVVSA